MANRSKKSIDGGSQTQPPEKSDSRTSKRFEFLTGKSVRLTCAASEYGTPDPVSVEGTFIDAVQCGMVVFFHLLCVDKARLVKTSAVVEMTEL